MTAKRSIRSALSLALLASAARGTPMAHPHAFAAHPRAVVPTAKAVRPKPPANEPVSPFASAATVMPFVENAVVQVYAAPERVTDIQLQAGESLVAVASGDTARWVIGDTQSGSGTGKKVHVLAKPVAAGLATNLIITTDRRTYHIALTSGSGAYVTSLSWIYPQDALLALKPASAGEAAASPPAVSSTPDVERFHFDYAISGDRPAWRPLRAFDDGQQSFIEFPPTLPMGEAPPLFLIGARGEVELVNYRVRGRFYIVDRIFDAAELRLGTKHQIVVRIVREGGATAAVRRPASAS